MKLKNIIPIFILLFAFACTTEFLDEVHPTKETSENFFTKDKDAQEAAISLYEGLWSNYGKNFDNWMASYDMSRGDNVILPKNFYNNSIVTYLTLNYNEESRSVKDAWKRCYEIIYRANWIIDNVSENENISEDVKNEALAEAYFMRGYNYFTLVRLFGEVPLVLKQSTPDSYYPEKATSEEVWAQVDADLQKALGMLPAPTGSFVDGRANKGVANAIIARTYLYRTKPGSTQYWDKVQQYAKATEGLGVYGLESMDDFSRLFVYTTDDDWVKNTEVIWAAGAIYGPIYGGRPFKYIEPSSTVGCGSVSPVGYATIVVHNDLGDPYIPANGRTGRATFAASPELADIMIDYGRLGDKRTSEFLFYPTFNNYGYSDPDDKTSVVVKQVINSDSLYQRLKETNGAEGEYLHIKKYMIRQFLGTNIWDGGYYHPMMMPIIRYADVLLMRAEAEFNLGNEGVAKEYLKRITDRAGFAADYVNQFSGGALHDEILKQRRVELMFEALRVPDLLRLDLFKPPHVGTYPGSVSWAEKLKVLPIPQRELDYNKNLTQNSLWK